MCDLSNAISAMQMYVALFPCNECAKMIIQSGIKEVVYMSDKHHATPSMRASRALLTMAKVYSHAILLFRCFVLICLIV